MEIKSKKKHYYTIRKKNLMYNYYNIYAHFYIWVVSKEEGNIFGCILECEIFFSNIMFWFYLNEILLSTSPTILQIVFLGMQRIFVTLHTQIGKVLRSKNIYS